MKVISSLFVLVLTWCSAVGKEATYVGSTPPHKIVRQFLGISLTDSIDFIRWKLVLGSGSYELQCQYGIGKPGTPGFIDEKRLAFSGGLKKEKNFYYLVHDGKTFSMLEINSNLIHLLDENKNPLVGNGGWSYTLSNNQPVKTDQLNLQLKEHVVKSQMVFEGRTPCQPLSTVIGMGRGPECYKLKWYIVFYADSITGQPSHYLIGGRSYKKETMDKGTWQIIRGSDGRITYKLDPDKQTYFFYLLRADENILLFTDAEGNLLVGDEDFSYTLNRRKEEHPATR